MLVEEIFLAVLILINFINGKDIEIVKDKSEVAEAEIKDIEIVKDKYEVAEVEIKDIEIVKDKYELIEYKKELNSNKIFKLKKLKIKKTIFKEKEYNETYILDLSKIFKEEKEDYNINNQTFKVSLYFKDGGIDLQSSSKIKIKKLINILNKKTLNRKIFIEGNSDIEENSNYNYILGLKRAIKIKEEILLNTLVLNDSFKIISFGNKNKVCHSTKKTCRSINNRVVIKLEKFK